MVSRYHQRTVSTSISTSRSTETCMWVKGGQRREAVTDHHAGLHLVLPLTFNIINVQNTSISTRLDAAMLFNGLEDLPAVLSVFLITCQPVSQEERFDCFRSVFSMLEIRTKAKEKSGALTGERNGRHRVLAIRRAYDKECLMSTRYENHIEGSNGPHTVHLWCTSLLYFPAHQAHHRMCGNGQSQAPTH